MGGRELGGWGAGVVVFSRHWESCDVGFPWVESRRRIDGWSSQTITVRVREYRAKGVNRRPCDKRRKGRGSGRSKSKRVTNLERYRVLSEKVG